jgi:hypothetical protein
VTVGLAPRYDLGLASSWPPATELPLKVVEKPIADHPMTALRDGGCIARRVFGRSLTRALPSNSDRFWAKSADRSNPELRRQNPNGSEMHMSWLTVVWSQDDYAFPIAK